MQRRGFHRLLVAACAAWATSAVRAQGIFIAPPPPRTEAIPPPRWGYAWNPGHWRWVRGRYVWVSGSWLRARAGRRWMPGRWVREGRRWEWIEGSWVQG